MLSLHATTKNLLAYFKPIPNVPIYLLAIMRMMFWGFLMSEDEVKGKIEKTKGRTREEAGKMTDDKSEQIKGKAEQAKGKLQEELGKAKKKI